MQPTTQGLKLYVAGQSGNADRVGRYASALTKTHGVVITEPWWDEVLRDSWSTENPPRTPAECARRDIDGILAADAMIVLIDLDLGDGRGLWFEAGYAKAIGKPVCCLVYGSDARTVGQAMNDLVFAHTMSTTYFLVDQYHASDAFVKKFLESVVGLKRRDEK